MSSPLRIAHLPLDGGGGGGGGRRPHTKRTGCFPRVFPPASSELSWNVKNVTPLSHASSTRRSLKSSRKRVETAYLDCGNELFPPPSFDLLLRCASRNGSHVTTRPFTRLSKTRGNGLFPPPLFDLLLGCVSRSGSHVTMRPFSHGDAP